MASSNGEAGKLAGGKVGGERVLDGVLECFHEATVGALAALSPRMSDSAYHVETAPRLAQWKIVSLPSSFSYRKSNPFRIGIWNWYLSVERNKLQVYVKLYPEASSLTRDRPPIASFAVKVISGSGQRRSFAHPGVSDKLLKNSDDFVWAIDIPITGKFIIDVEFHNLKTILGPGAEPSSIWSAASTAAVHVLPAAATAALSSLGSMLSDAVHADITLHAADGPAVPAHRAVLASRSPVFHSMFSHDLREKALSAVDLPDMSSAACRAFLNYLYGVLDPEGFAANRLPLLRAADKYDVRDLRASCEESLLEDVDAANVLERLQAAHTYGLSSLKEACMRYLVGFGKIYEVREELHVFLLRGDRDLVAEVFQEVLAAWKGF